MTGAGVVSTLLTRGDLRGLSMLRPTRLHRGILNICLHADSPKIMIHMDAIRTKQKQNVGRKMQKKEYMCDIYETAMKVLASCRNCIFSGIT